MSAQGARQVHSSADVRTPDYQGTSAHHDKPVPRGKRDEGLSSSPKKKPRIALFDNMKGIAIFLVVLGHFTGKAGMIVDSHFLTTVLTFIYLFHMPLFLFCSGIFAGKAWYKRHQAPSDKVLLYLILYGVFLLLIVLLDILVFQKMPGVNPFVITSAPWFMLVLALFMLMVPIMGSVRPVSFILVSIALAVGSGLFLEEAGTLSLSRFFVYLPYFAMGFYLGPDNITKFVDAIQSRVGEQMRIILAAVTLALIFLVLFLCFSDDQLTAIKRLSTGMNLLTVLSVHWDISIPFLVVLRLVLYPSVFAMGMVVTLLCPKDKCFLTFMGKRSFQVYIFHILILYCFKNYHVYGGFISTEPWITLSPFIIAAVLTPLLAWPKGPNDLVKKCSDWTKKVTKPRSHPMEKVA